MNNWASFSFLSIVLTLILWQQPCLAQVGDPYQLSGDMVVFGDVSGPGIEVPRYLISPDGQYVVYVADQLIDGVSELFSVPIGGGNAVRLNPNLVINGDVSSISLSISSDSARVVYRADQRIDGVIELFSVPITGGSAIPLVSNVTATTGVTQAKISPDSSRVVYIADSLTDEQRELFSVPIGGGQSTRLNSNIVADGDVEFFLFSPDSTRVVYLADQLVDSEREIFSVPITGGTPIRLLPSMVTNGSVRAYRISPDGNRVVYRADRINDEVVELFSVLIAGGGTRRLSPTPVSGGDIFLNRFEISPDSQRVVFIADSNVDEMFELFSIGIGSLGPATRLSPALAANEDILSFKITPDSTRVLYSSDQLADDVFQLWRVPIEGGSSFRINANFTLADGDVVDYQISPDSQTVVYRADTVFDQVFVLFSSPILSIAGTDAIQLTPNSPPSREVLRDFEISPDGERVIYRSDIGIDDRFDIFSVPLLGGSASRLNSSLPFGSDIDDFLISANGQYVVFQGDPDVFDENEIFGHLLKELPKEDDELCVPIKTQNDKIALICL